MIAICIRKLQTLYDLVEMWYQLVLCLTCVSVDETGCRCGRNSFADINSSKKCVLCIFSHKTVKDIAHFTRIST